MGKISDVEPSPFLDMVMESREELKRAYASVEDKKRMNSMIQLRTNGKGMVAIVFMHEHDFIMLDPEEALAFAQEITGLIIRDRPDLALSQLRELTDRVDSAKKNKKPH